MFRTKLYSWKLWKVSVDQVTRRTLFLYFIGPRFSMFWQTNHRSLNLKIDNVGWNLNTGLYEHYRLQVELYIQNTRKLCIQLVVFVHLKTCRCFKDMCIKSYLNIYFFLISEDTSVSRSSLSRVGILKINHYRFIRKRY